MIIPFSKYSRQINIPEYAHIKKQNLNIFDSIIQPQKFTKMNEFYKEIITFFRFFSEYKYLRTEKEHQTLITKLLFFKFILI